VLVREAVSAGDGSGVLVNECAIDGVRLDALK